MAKGATQIIPNDLDLISIVHHRLDHQLYSYNQTFVVKKKKKKNIKIAANFSHVKLSKVMIQHKSLFGSD